MKLVFATLLLVCLVLSSSFIEVTMAAGSPFCDSRCGLRCSKSKQPKRCLWDCGICCKKCNCVPSGTSGNKDECPCYRDLLTSKKKPKCP